MCAHLGLSPIKINGIHFLSKRAQNCTVKSVPVQLARVVVKLSLEFCFGGT